MRKALLLVSLLVVLGACANAPTSNTSQVATHSAPVIPPALGQSYGTTDRELSAYKWSNSDNTQVPNIYKIPLDSGSVTVRVMYVATPDGEKRVSDIHYYNFDGTTWGILKNLYLTRGASKRRLAEIGGNIQEVFGTDEPQTATAYFHSASLVDAERKAHIRPCTYDSNQRGLLIVQDTFGDDGSVREVYLTDAALHYCAKLL